jgi:general secretion pathway protein L
MNLDTTIAIDLKGFFRWWGKELAFLVPKSLRQRFRDHYGRLIFTPVTEGFEAAFFDDDGNLITKQNLEATGSHSFQSLKSQHPGIEKAEILLRLAKHQALYKLIYLPGAAQENLQQVVGFELDRYTPFKADQVYYTTVLQGKTEQGQLKVLLIVVPKPILDQQLTSLEKLGVQPHKIDYEAVLADFPELDDSYNLLPERYQQRSSALSQYLSWLVGSLALTLALAAMIWPVWLEGQAVDTLKARIQQLEKQTRVVDNQQGEIDALRAETQKLIDNKAQAPSILAALNELSLVLKEDTWLTHLQFNDKRMQIQGQSPAASALIGLLESSEYFSNVSFVSPLTQDKTTGRERFQISMDVSTPIEKPEADESEDTDSEDAEDSEDATDAADADTEADSEDTTGDEADSDEASKKAVKHE